MILDEFEEAVRPAGSDDGAGAVVVTGAGGAFCAGTDLADLAELGECFGSDDRREGVVAFPERRPAAFTRR